MVGGVIATNVRRMMLYASYCTHAAVSCLFLRPQLPSAAHNHHASTTRKLPATQNNNFYKSAYRLINAPETTLLKVSHRTCRMYM